MMLILEATPGERVDDVVAAAVAIRNATQRDVRVHHNDWSAWVCAERPDAATVLADWHASMVAR